MIKYDTFSFLTQVHFSLAFENCFVYQMRFVAWVYFSRSIVTIMCTKKSGFLYSLFFFFFLLVIHHCCFVTYISCVVVN